MERLFLIRHGQTAWNAAGRYQGHTDVPLDAVGRTQAARLAERLSAESIDALYASDLRRARETAAQVAGRLGIAVRDAAALREIGCGAFEGLTGDEIDARWPGRRARFLAREEGAPKGERIADAASRVTAFVGRLGAEHPSATVALVSHGFLLRLLCAELFSTAPGPMPRMAPMTNTAITLLAFEPGGPRVLLANDAGHAQGAATL